MSQILTDEEIACYDPAIARAIESAVLAKIATTPAASPTPIDARTLPFAILDDELAALRRLYETCEDGQDYDVPTKMISRLAEIGLVTRTGARLVYRFTNFGLSVINGDFAASTTPEPSPLVVPRWISVEDQMPELGVEVLVFKPGNQWGEVQFDTWDEQHEAPVSFSSQTVPIGPGWDNEDDFYAITHWMLKPAAPVQVKGEA